MADKEKICGIYCIENLVNHKRYIGQSIDIKCRWRNHRYELNANKHGNNHLQSAWDKYGKEKFKFSIIERCDVSCLDEIEMYYIVLYHANDDEFGYNETSGGQTNKRLSNAAREKISKARKGMPISEECKRKLSEANSGRFTGIEHHNHKPVYCYELHEYFWGAEEVKQKYGINSSSVTQCCKKHGNRYSAGKHPVTGEPLHWDYVDQISEYILQATQN